MAKRKRKYKKRKKVAEEEYFLGLNPETKIGIIAIAIFTVAVILFLSFFGLAGGAGRFIDNALAISFGWDRWLVPVVMMIIGSNLIWPERIRMSTFNYIGFVFFFLSFNGLVNLIALKEKLVTSDNLIAAGGYLGMLMKLVMESVFGFWGGLVAIAAVLLVSVLLIFNTSLRSVMGMHTHVTGPFGSFLHLVGLRRKVEDGDEDEDWIEDEEEWEVDEDEEEEAEEEDEEVPTKSKRGKKSVEANLETALTTTKHRKKIDVPLDLLETRSSKPNSGDIKNNKEIIRRTFEQFNISVEMGNVEVGPTVTQFTLRPSEGVKLTRITSLHNDLALALAAHPIRIEAPIPGKPLVGIEVPNQSVAMVSLRELFEAKEFKNRPTDLTVALGKDVSGACWVMPIEKMPHMLVAGATGAGKSVCLNTIILSLLYQNGPDDLRLILVDPKRVELTAYTGLPHLLVPPITKVDETINALKWTVREMERRLEVLSKFGSRDITSYNKKAKAKMPKIVVIIDELADLMTTSARDVETAIIRIAQMARATGIHLILATQRPSVDVITGLIKANIPCRVAFAVASLTDSRTILDSSGAEKLLGRGDMLFSSADMSTPKRLQGAFVSEKEISRVVGFLKNEDAPDYNYEITETQKVGSVFGGNSDSEEPLLEEAIQALLQAGRASTSLLQRRLKVGYARAARIIDMLEEQGVVGPAEGSKPREILIESMDDLNGDSEDDYEDAEEDEDLTEEDENDEEADDDTEIEEEEDNEEDEDEVTFEDNQEGEYLDEDEE